MDDRYKKYVECICGIAIISFIIIKWLFKDLEIWDELTYASTFTSFVVILYVTILWRINPFEKIPKLKKEYIGTLISTYDNKKRDVKIIIKQNLFETKIIFKSNESSSKSITANFYDEYGTQMLSFGYINNPKAMYKDKSPIHYGLCILEIKDKNHLEGQYFTDRCTRGDIKLQTVSKK
ncbi:MAG: hypothetical protein IKG42_06760 [Clostridia bacterium]|nr:hypothetical protein [Clostridia bacterium]